MESLSQAQAQIQNTPEMMAQLGVLFEKIATTPEMPARIYEIFSLVSEILLKYKSALESGQTTGWADEIELEDGTPAFQPHEARMLESAVAPMEGAVRGMFAEQAQRGGAGTANRNEALRRAGQALGETLKDDSTISLDGAVETVAEFFENLNKTSKRLAEKAGISRFEKAFPVIPVPTPFAGVPVPVSSRLIVLVAQGVLEFLRVMYAYSETKAGVITRVFTSIAGALLEGGKGDWKSSLFTLIGVFSGNMVVIGVIGKILVKVVSFISEDLRANLAWDAYDSAKSWFAGFWIFVFSVFAPAPVRGLVETQLGELNTIIEDINTKMGETVTALEGNPAFKCYKVTWDKMDTIDFGSLERLQNLMNNPGFFCSKEILTMIDSLKYNPPVRVILELLGLPTTSKSIARACSKLPAHLVGQTLGATLIHGLEPELTLIAPAPAGCEAPPSVEAVRQTLAKVFTPSAQP